MLAKLRKMIHKDDGFTLIELLIVIIILGILAAIVVFGVSTFRDDANEKACIADRKATEVAAQAYVAKTGTAPASYTNLTSGGYLKTQPAGTYGTKTFTFAQGVAGTGGC